MKPNFEDPRKSRDNKHFGFCLRRRTLSGFVFGANASFCWCNDLIPDSCHRCNWEEAFLEMEWKELICFDVNRIFWKVGFGQFVSLVVRKWFHHFQGFAPPSSIMRNRKINIEEVEGRSEPWIHSPWPWEGVHTLSGGESPLSPPEINNYYVQPIPRQTYSSPYLYVTIIYDLRVNSTIHLALTTFFKMPHFHCRSHQSRWSWTYLFFSARKSEQTLLS